MGHFNHPTVGYHPGPKCRPSARLNSVAWAHDGRRAVADRIAKLRKLTSTSGSISNGVRSTSSKQRAHGRNVVAPSVVAVGVLRLPAGRALGVLRPESLR